MSNFGQRLLSFVQSVDIVDSRIYGEVKGKFERYCREELDIKMCTLLVPLRSGEEGIYFGLKGQEGWGYLDTFLFPPELTGQKVKGQAMYSWINKKNLWIIDQDERPISRQNSVYLEQWSQTPHEELPKYRKQHANGDVYTSIIVPIPRAVNERGKGGVVNFELGSYIPFSPQLSEEFANLAEAFYQIYRLHSNFEQQTSNSVNVVQALPVESFKYYKHDVFFAYPENGEPDVIKLIKKILNEQKLTFYDWEGSHQPGHIGTEIRESIKASRIGICYFSETNKEKSRYQDSHNVIFEAGMLESLTQWIAIRENTTRDLFFDIQQNRFIIPPRENGNELDIKTMSDKLKNTLEELLSTSQ